MCPNPEQIKQAIHGERHVHRRAHRFRFVTAVRIVDVVPLRPARMDQTALPCDLDDNAFHVVRADCRLDPVPEPDELLQREGLPHSRRPLAEGEVAMFGRSGEDERRLLEHRAREQACGVTGRIAAEFGKCPGRRRVERVTGSRMSAGAAKPDPVLGNTAACPRQSFRDG